MNKKSIWLVILSIVTCSCLAFGIVGCKNNNKYVATTALQIANKAELQADWFEDGENREVKLTLPPELTADDVYVTSSDPAVVLVEGKTLKAAGVGIAKIVVRANDETDSVNITVKPSLKEISITNRGELRNIVIGEERTLEYSIKPDVVDIDKLNIEITSSNTGVVSVSGKKLKAESLGESTITVKAGNYSDTIDINVINLEAPSFGVEDGAVVDGVTNSEIKLPVAALSCDGIDLHENVQSTCSSGLKFDRESMSVTAENKGEYEIELEVTDPRDGSLTSSVNLIIKVYRKIFADYNGYGNIGYESYEEGKQFTDDEKQVATFDRWDATFASFDMQPSQIYYAEFIIDSESKADWSTFYGMTHSVKGDATRWLTAYMDRGAAVTRDPEEGEEQGYYSGARDFRIKDIDIVNDMDCWQLHQGNNPKTQILYSYGLNRFRGLDKIESFPCKMATARIGDFFYFFVNDDYVCAVTNQYLQGKDTVPGFFQQSSIKTDIKNIVWLNGSEAQTKFNSLTDNGSKMFSEYAPSEWWMNENEASEHITYSSSSELGTNYTFDTDGLTGENKGIVTPYIFFDGDFTFEWEYKFDDASAAGNWDRFMGLEVRHLRDENSSWGSNYSNKYAFLFGSMRQNGSDGNDICAMVKCFSKDKPDDWDWEHPTMSPGGKEWYSNNDSLRYRVTRICAQTADGRPVAKYTFTIERADGTERSVWKYDDYGLDNWKSPCEPVILLWKNKGVKGTYFNVKWSIPQDGVEISNKTALMQKWTVGEADRKVETMLAGRLEGPVTVISSNENVISVNGEEITAVGRGTATITVKIGDYIDTVEITVTPKLDSVTITNKDELTAEWKLSAGESRDVKIAYAPSDIYDANNTDVKITSSNENVIMVNGNTLTAIGSGRTTIIISVGDIKDTVEITVTADKPVLSLEDSSPVYGMVGDEIILPEYTVISVEGDEVQNPEVLITCENANISTGIFTATQSGKYIVTYSYQGADEVSVAVYVYRKVISSIFAEGDEVKVQYIENTDCIDDEKQTITLDTTKNTYAQFNMAADKNFYAEATFVISPQSGNQNFYGLYAADPTVPNRYLAVMTDRGVITEEWHRAVKVIDFDTTKENWTDVESTKFWCRNVFQYGQKITEKAEGSVAIALARVNDIFYMLIDGQAVMGFTAQDYNGKNMVVGVFQKNAVSGTQITAMNYVSGDAAQTKFNALTQNGSDLLGEYRYNSWWEETNSASEHISSSADASKGTNFTFTGAVQGENAGVVTPNINFDGDFTFEWEFEFAEGTTGGNWDKYMSVELRTAENSDWGFKFITSAQVNGDNNICISANINVDTNSDLGGAWMYDENYAGHFKFAVSRKINAESTTITFKAWKLNEDGEYELVHDKSWTGTEVKEFGAANSPAIVVIKTVNCEGEYTNIKWSAAVGNN